ncbi:hypothetical protein [Nocardia blacklockiae]|uniref:hypothetical protein n=1 Tax=Nocardia blacklockiae TaxID=480036 RepID=UPI001895F219|nr:hypothetical protein [Nocardia blacklockiae]MBF6169855.1 hypothetical protein [Nocardia blacklockiae]
MLSPQRRFLTSRRAVEVYAVFIALFVFPGIVGAVATAQSGTSANGELSWMDVRDSSGVSLSNYLIVTDYSFFNPGKTVVSALLELEFVGYMAIVTSAIWMIGFVLGLGWLNTVGAALQGVAAGMTDQVATTAALITGVTIGALIVGIFLIRGHFAKAKVQVVTMFAVAVLGPVFLADPLGEVLSADGFFVQARNVGIAVAAGVNGNDNPDPDRVVASMQETLADNFARKPVQVWNFGHIVDERPACGAGWSAGQQAGSADRVLDTMRACGDMDAYAHAKNPGMGQVGAGLILMFSVIVLLGFSAYLAGKVFGSTMRTIYHLFRLIFGVAFGGFVYGPTQIALIRDVTDVLIGAARMFVYVVFVGIYTLFIGNLFRQAPGQVTSVMMIAAVVMVVAIFQLARLSKGMDRGHDWLAQRLAGATLGNGSGGGTSGAAMGMGTTRANGTLAAGMLTGLAAVSTISNSPATEWLAGRTRSPLRPFSRTERRAQRATWGVWNSPGFGGEQGWYRQSYLNRQQFAEAARRGAARYGGVDTVKGVAAALQGLQDRGGTLGDAQGALLGAGFSDQRLIGYGIRSWGIVDANAEDETLADKHLGHVVAAMQRTQHSANRVARNRGDAAETAADLATLQASTFRYRRANPGGVTLDGGIPGGPQTAWVTDYMANPARRKIQALQQLASGDPAPAGAGLGGIDQNGAARMMTWIGNEHARLVQGQVDRLLADPTDPQRIRDARAAIVAATDTDQWASGVHRTPWNSLAPPGNNPPPRNWRDRMQPVADLLR